MIDLREHYRLEARRDDRRQEAFRREQRRLREQAEERREQAESRAEDADLLVATAIATSEEIARVTAKLDRYDVATIEALQLNEEQLAAVQAEIDHLLLEAHVLPDGRRVFKTEDGTRVFDEAYT